MRTGLVGASEAVVRGGTGSGFVFSTVVAWLEEWEALDMCSEVEVGGRAEKGEWEK